MKYIKLFESWATEINEAEGVIDPESIAKTFPIDSKQWGSMDFVTGKDVNDTKGLADYLKSKVDSLTKNLPVKFKVVYNQKDKMVEISPANDPKNVFKTQGSISKAAAGSGGARYMKENPYSNTLFNYDGFVYENGEEIPGDEKPGEEQWKLGQFLSAAMQKKSVADLSTKPVNLALDIAAVWDSSKQGKVITSKEVETKMKSSGKDAEA